MEEQAKGTTTAEEGDGAARPDRRTHLPIFIFDHGEDTPHVEPGHGVVPRQGGSVQWHNLTKHDVVIVLPSSDIFAGAGSVVEVPQGKTSDVLRVKGNAERGGHVYSGVQRSTKLGPRLLKGGSNPVIIIR